MKKIMLAMAACLTIGLAMGQTRFDACLMGGFNMSQIDGDGAGKYNHPGFRVGVGSSFTLSGDTDSPWRMVVELAYTQKGSYINATDRNLSVNYVEVPVMISYNMIDNRLRFAAGVAPAIQVGASVTTNGVDEPQSAANFTRMDWLPLTATARYRFATHTCIELRYQNSMLSITKENGSGTYRFFRSNTGAFSRLLTIGLAYQF